MACKSFSCYLQSLKDSSEHDVTEKIEIENVDTNFEQQLTYTVPDEFEHLTPDPSTFRIIFPVVMVISVMIVVIVGFLLHRLISHAMWNNWSISGTGDEQYPARGRSRRRRGEQIRTISSYVDVPPTYKQVMQSIKLEQEPPTYFQVMSGKVNCGFVSEEDVSVVMVDALGNIDEGEKRNTNSLIHSRSSSVTSSQKNQCMATVHREDAISNQLGVREERDSDSNTESNDSDPEEWTRRHSLGERRNSSDGHGSVNSFVTVAEVNVVVEELSENHTRSVEENNTRLNESICSAV